MFLSTPKGMKDPVVRGERERLLLTEPRVQPLRAWGEQLIAARAARGLPTDIPHFDPAEAGVDARVLVVMESPGPRATANGTRPGSGFISVDNDDNTAANCWYTRDEVGLHDFTLHWNIVPWYLGGAKIKPTAAELSAGAQALTSLLPLFPELRALVFCGLVAQRAHRRFLDGRLPRSITTLTTWHPSPLALKQPGKREQFREALVRAANLAA